jgi:hypothetical protein
MDGLLRLACIRLQDSGGSALVRSGATQASEVTQHAAHGASDKIAACISPKCSTGDSKLHPGSLHWSDNLDKVKTRLRPRVLTIQQQVAQKISGHKFLRAVANAKATLHVLG